MVKLKLKELLSKTERIVKVLGKALFAYPILLVLVVYITKSETMANAVITMYFMHIAVWGAFMYVELKLQDEVNYYIFEYRENTD